MNAITARLAVITLLLLLLAGCDTGGVGDGGNGANGLPILHGLSSSEGMELTPGVKTTLTADAADPDDDRLIYRWRATGGIIDGTLAEVEWTASSVGWHTVVCVVDDGISGQDANYLTLHVYLPGPVVAPALLGLTASPGTAVAPGQLVTITARTTESVALNYAWSATGGSLSGAGNTIAWLAPQGEGDYAIICSTTGGPAGPEGSALILAVRQG